MTQLIQMEKSDWDKLLNVVERCENVVNRCEKLMTAQGPPKNEIPERGGVELAVQVMGKSKSWIYKMIPLLPHKKFGHSLVFERVELEKFMQDNYKNPYEGQLILNENLKRSALKRTKYQMT